MRKESLNGVSSPLKPLCVSLAIPAGQQIVPATAQGAWNWSLVPVQILIVEAGLTEEAEVVVRFADDWNPDGCVWGRPDAKFSVFSLNSPRGKFMHAQLLLAFSTGRGVNRFVDGCDPNRGWPLINAVGLQ
jgi:hypothetical protein